MDFGLLVQYNKNVGVKTAPDFFRKKDLFYLHFFKYYVNLWKDTNTKRGLAFL